MNGLEALDVIANNQIDCIVCDINMPKMNGIELIKAIREQGNNVPFIFFTGHGCRELMLESVKHGAFDFVDKPNLEGLEEVVLRGLAYNPEEELDSLSNEDFTSEFRILMDELER